MFVRLGGKVYVAPFGSEYLGHGTNGVPVVYYRSGVVGVMAEVTPKPGEA